MCSAWGLTMCVVLKDQKSGPEGTWLRTGHGGV